MWRRPSAPRRDPKSEKKEQPNTPERAPCEETSIYCSGLKGPRDGRNGEKAQRNKERTPREPREGPRGQQTSIYCSRLRAAPGRPGRTQNRDLADPDAEGDAPRARTVGHQATPRRHMHGYAPRAALPALFRKGACLLCGICLKQYFLLRRSGHSFCCVSCRSGGFPLRRRKRANKNNLTHFFFLFYFIPHVSVGLWGRVFCARGKTWFRGPTPKKSEDDGVLAQEPPPGCQAQT